MKFLKAKAIIAATFALSASGTFADTVTSSLSLKYTQKDECAVAGRAVPQTSFSTLSAGQTNSFVPFDVTCTTNTPFNVTLGVGQVTGSTVQSRLLKGDTNGNDLTVEMYRDAAFTQVWGMDPNVNSFDGNGANGTFSPVVYMKIPEQKNLLPDSYNGTFTVVISY